MTDPDRVIRTMRGNVGEAPMRRVCAHATE